MMKPIAHREEYFQLGFSENYSTDWSLLDIEIVTLQCCIQETFLLYGPGLKVIKKSDRTSPEVVEQQISAMIAQSEQIKISSVRKVTRNTSSSGDCMGLIKKEAQILQNWDKKIIK